MQNRHRIWMELQSSKNSVQSPKLWTTTAFHRAVSKEFLRASVTFTRKNYGLSLKRILEEIYMRHNSQNIVVFKQLTRTSMLMVCHDDCVHQTQYKENRPIKLGIFLNIAPCIYQLRPEIVPYKYVSRLWKELPYAFRDPHTPCINKEVRRFMKKLIANVGKKYRRFVGKLVQVGSFFWRHQSWTAERVRL